MNRILARAGVFGLVVGVCGLVALADTPKTIKEVMANHKKNQLRDQIGADLKKDDPDWLGVQKKTKEYSEAVAALEKMDPPKGEKKDFTKLAKDIAGTAKELDEAAKKKDKKAATTAHQKLGTYCMTCHKAHRP